MSKRYIGLVALVAAFALVVAACGDDDAATTTTTTTQAPGIGEGRIVGMAFDVGGRGDLSFNDLAAAGWDQGRADFGYTGTELSPLAGGENREENLVALAEDGSDLIIANGFAFAVNVGRVAQDFPDVFFAITDDCARAEDFSQLDLDNVACMLFAEEQGSFLVGAIAALKTETGVVGFIGGVNVPLIHKFQAGFEAGVRHVDPDVTILPAVYLTEPPDFAGFGSPDLGKEAALALFGQGADIVYHAAGGSGLGLFQAAQEVTAQTGSKVWGIGVDADQYNTVGADLQEYVLTSMIKRVDVAVYKTIEAFLTGTWQKGENRFGLAADGVGYSRTGGFIDDIVDEVEALREQIISGEIVVPTTP